ncbi:multiple sugar transport system permease protein [Ruminococcus sp. YE71]|uniref:carbohydrate ABC transporter permease n=1 Tax=unclassified Ruminococcus TaxID=2608920 RepID=UPI000886E335|nr:MULTISPECIES: carbohydrate ABC transporter permease [unclassified Ruminococcus]SDA27752.1 multiple sugar transport system permease protein [Ruminococcus sp. YE78]SFW46071.1 multiple sugar transport system permease protein [Ruminococcus sp. YE71]
MTTTAGTVPSAPVSSSSDEIKSRAESQKTFKIVAYTVCVLLTVMCLFPFVIMIVNSTRSTTQIQQHSISLIPGTSLLKNFAVLTGKSFNPLRGFLNSLGISFFSTLCNIYFSTMTAFALVAYNWKLRKPFFTVIMAVLMIPAQVTSIGFYQFMYQIGMTNNFLALILPSIAAPTTVFFMRQYMIPSLPMEILQSARIDGAREFRIFNQIVLPMMKPAMATQAIFAFVGKWNEFFLSSILLTKQEKYTMPIMVSLLKGDIYKTEYGAIYLGLFLTVLPLLAVYFLLSKYIVAGVALGGVKS